MNKFIYLFILCLTSAVQAKAELAVIVHPESEIEQLSNHQLANIFLVKTKRFPNGQRVRPAELSSPQAKAYFYHKVVGKTEVELRKYWATIVFSGLGRPPKQFHSIDSIIQYVRSKPGAIAYIPKGSATPSVKVLALTQ